MKRSELTVKAMEDRGWTEVKPRTEPLIKDIVCCIKDGFYKYLRCTVDESYTWAEREYNMCSTYEHSFCYEYLEVSLDNATWYRVAKRKHELGRRCVWAE